jgi:hypothetical protein
VISLKCDGKVSVTNWYNEIKLHDFDSDMPGDGDGEDD